MAICEWVRGGGIIRTIVGPCGYLALSDTYRLLRFGVFELNLDQEELRKNGSVLKLPPQPFRLLAMLASRSGQVVTRDEIQQQLWSSDTFIDFEQDVNKCVKQIRGALGDNADNPLYIETIPRHGYRFLAPVRTKIVPPPPPQVKEASSGLIADVAGEVRARVDASAQGLTSAGLQTGERSMKSSSAEISVGTESPVGNKRSRMFLILVSLTLLLIVALYWILQHGPQ
jgi:DNA-binding winged helix-turn-helix (wHTH) protein